MPTRLRDALPTASGGYHADELEDGTRRTMVHAPWTALLLGSLLFVPGAFGYFFEDLSFATGTAVVSVAILILAAVGQIPTNAHRIQKHIVIIFSIALFILIHLLFAYAIDHDPSFNFGRALLSLALMSLILFTVPAVCDGILEPDNGLAWIVKSICALFAFFALLSLLQIQPPMAGVGSKPTFPFTEPSFLGFSMPAVLIFTMARSSAPVRVAILGIFLALGYLLSNFTIIAACALAAVVTLPFSWFAAGVGVILASLANLDLTYYTERLNFDWANSTNLSSLVYVQGWQMLQESISRTYAVGVGFQQLGIVYTNVPASYKINMILGYDLNLQDGGFILSKIGSELGVVGILIVSAYFYIAAKSLLTLRKILSRAIKVSDGEIFAFSCMVGYVIELMVRGTNYFTGTFVLMLASGVYIMKHNYTGSYFDKQIPSA